MSHTGFTRTKKAVAALLLACLLFWQGAPLARAEAWGTNAYSAYLETALEEIKRAARAMILTAMKQAANKIIRDQVRKLVAGTSDRVVAVVDYEDFIFGSADRTADKLVTDFFRGVLDDASRETRAEMRMVERTIRNELEPQIPGIDFQTDYYINSASPRSDIFDQRLGGGSKAYLAFQMGGEHPFDVYLNTKAALEEKLRRQQEASQAKVIAGQGFNSPNDDQNNVLPGSVVKEIMAKAETMDIDAINNAENWQEVVAATATAAISSLVRNGVRVVSQPINNATRELERRIDRGTDNLLDQLYGPRR